MRLPRKPFKSNIFSVIKDLVYFRKYVRQYIRMYLHVYLVLFEVCLRANM